MSGLEINKQESAYIVFTTHEPFAKRLVQLKRSTWEYHVTGGDHYRPELIGQEHVVKQVIADPKYIQKDDHPSGTREQFIDIVDLPALRHFRALKVVVDFANGVGDVVTIHVDRSPKKTEGGVIYVRPSRVEADK